ncbi:MAG: PglZ domain-containing protein [Rhodothermales bacterium]|nr:PglZ domain-containing protein [Rhodothermales bacterium]MBO6778677.1 PglZ domain-containing protein [Rhodothermales bacterium]
MSRSFTNYLADQLDRRLRDHRVVVFYDPREEFASFIDGHQVVGTGLGGLPRIVVGDSISHLARFEGSFFSLKTSLEPVVEAERPEAVLVYVPGVERDRQGSVLMELEVAGECYEPQLRRLARNLLRTRFTDGDIDEMLAPDALTFQDIERLLEQEGGDKGSMLKLVLGSGSSESLICKWLATDDYDANLESKVAQPELYRLIHARLGLPIERSVSLAKARKQTLRFVLVNEFRQDLTGNPPDCISLVPEPTTSEARQRIGSVAEELRKLGEGYIAQADAIEAELDLSDAIVNPEELGSIDTFRFEERVLLGFAAKLISDGRHEEALAIVSGRGHSFWVDHPSFLDRLAQWEACRLAAELGSLVSELTPAIKMVSGGAAEWIGAYTKQDGWYRADQTQRALEHWVASMEDEPEEPLAKALWVVRRGHEELLEQMAHGFTKALVESSWTVPEVLHQTQIYSDLVEPKSGTVAYFFVDAMRFEMGADLVQQLDNASELVLQPAVGVLPSITPLGMGALLPGASGGYSVVEHKQRLASQIGGQVLPDLAKRQKYLRSVRPDSVDMDLGFLLQKSIKALRTKIVGADLIVVRSQSIDGLGEMDGGLLARQIMDTVVGNIARAVRKLAKAGVAHFVITSDHGHQFSIRKAEDMMMDKPGGDTIDQHRRCWAGRGGQTSAASVRVSGAQLGYQTDLDFIFPAGLAVFRCGGDLAFHHGGCSLQELVIPVISLRMPTGEPETAGSNTVVAEGYPRVLTNRTFGFRLVRETEMFNPEPISARVVLIGDGQEVGRAGMATGAQFDRATATLQLPPGSSVSVGMMLTRETSKKVRIVVMDPASDTILAQSDEIEIGELI